MYINKKSRLILGGIALSLCIPLTGLAEEKTKAEELSKPEVDRTELPVKGPWYPAITTLDARDVKAPP
ncbi:MAG: hypothetical protein WBN45_11035, partial [Arenicellales bacterium]